MSPQYWDETAGGWVDIPEDVVANDGYYGRDIDIDVEAPPEQRGVWIGNTPDSNPYNYEPVPEPPAISGPPVVIGAQNIPPMPQEIPPAGQAWQFNKEVWQWLLVPAESAAPYSGGRTSGPGAPWFPGGTGPIVPGIPNPPPSTRPGGGTNPNTGLPTTQWGDWRNPGGSGYGTGFGRLVVQPVAAPSELAVLNYIRAFRGARGLNLGDVQSALNNPTFALEVAQTLGMNVQDVQGIFSKVLSTGVSGILMALTGNFPLAAMGYFASDRALGGGNSIPFQGWPGGAFADGQLVLPMGMPVPDGLPNEIFNDFRFVCYDQLAQRWWPTDEIRPLAYQGGPFRWLALDRVDGKLYHANWIKKPQIYV